MVAVLMAGLFDDKVQRRNIQAHLACFPDYRRWLYCPAGWCEVIPRRN